MSGLQLMNCLTLAVVYFGATLAGPPALHAQTGTQHFKEPEAQTD